MRINHPDISLSEKTWLSLPLVASETSITVQSSNTFETNDFVVIGELGQERSELRKLSGVTDAVTLGLVGSEPLFDHPTNTSVTQIRYNKIKVYSASSKEGAYTELSISPFDIDTDKMFTTVYNDAETSSTWYKITYYNSSTLLESDYSDPLSASGAEQESVSKMVASVRRNCKLGDDVNIINDDEIIDIFNECQGLIQNMKGFKLQEATQTLSSVVGQSEYPLPDDVLKVRDLSITYANNIYYPEYVERDVFNSFERAIPTKGSNVSHYTIWGNSLHLRPLATTAGTGDIKLLYYKKLEPLKSDGDIPETTQVDVLVNYASQIISAIRENWKASQFWEQKFNASMGNLIGTGAIKQSTKYNRTKRVSTVNRNTNYPSIIS